MGCCKSIQEAFEVDISNAKERFQQEIEDLDSSNLLEDLSLRDNSNELDFHFGYTEIEKGVFSTRDSNHSVHIRQLKAH